MDLDFPQSSDAVTCYDSDVSQFDRAVSQFDRAVSQCDRAVSIGRGFIGRGI